MNKLLLIILLFFLLIFFRLHDNKLTEFYNSKIYEIKNINPKYIINEKSKIAFVYFYTQNIYDYCQHSIKNITAYCNKYNYAFIIYNTPLNDEVSMCWNKIAVIIKNLSSYNYLVWIDADALINNMNISIESIINTDPNKDLYICEDIIIDKECVNSGVMIIKNTEWSMSLFNKIWNSSFPHGHNDQNVIFYEITKEIYPQNDITLKYSKFCKRNIHPKVGIFSENLFNTHIYSYKQNDFILHLMGYNSKSRTSIMRQINNKLGLDTYNSNDCIKLIDSNDYNDRKNKIIKVCEI